MPAWATIVLSLGTAGIGAGAALTASLIQLRHARRERELVAELEWRERGAGVVGRVFGVLNDMEPTAIAAGRGRSKLTIENIGRRWWRTRDDLLVFASGHPSAVVADLADVVVASVSAAWEAMKRFNDEVVDGKRGDLTAAKKPYDAAVEAAQRLRAAIRAPSTEGSVSGAVATGAGP
jgi:hypothetical protein